MAETRSPVVHVCAWRQQQLRALLGVRQEHPLLGKNNGQHENLQDKDEVKRAQEDFTKRYCARAAFCGILRYNPPVISQACKTERVGSPVWCLQWFCLEKRVENQIPAEEDLSPCPRHTRLSGCSVFKKKTFLRVLQYKENPLTCRDVTCFCAAKMTFMKFIYWRAQSSAAFITYSENYKRAVNQRKRTGL